jgi:hypothetical protein
MKDAGRKFFWFILRFFEKGDEDYPYKPSYRTALNAVGVLFLVLVGVSLYFGTLLSGYGFLVPTIVFFAAGVTCIVVGVFGTDRAIARIWFANRR